jgi:hypothetical protein
MSRTVFAFLDLHLDGSKLEKIMKKTDIYILVLRRISKMISFSRSLSPVLIFSGNVGSFFFVYGRCRDLKCLSRAYSNILGCSVDRSTVALIINISAKPETSAISVIIS